MLSKKIISFLIIAMSKKEGKVKRGLNAYMFFANEKRPDLIKKYPEMKIGEIGKKLGEMWKNLDDDKKEPYKQKAIQDKERYKQELANAKAGKITKPESDSDKTE